jgi:hypothetical protein
MCCIGAELSSLSEEKEFFIIPDIAPIGCASPFGLSRFPLQMEPFFGFIAPSSGPEDPRISITPALSRRTGWRGRAVN